MSRYIGRREFFGSVWYDRDNLEYVFCDSTVTKMLDSGNPGEVHPVCQDRLKSLFEHGFRILNTQPAENNVLSAPLQVYFDFTTVCNLQCLHCYTNSGAKCEELDLD